MKTDLKQIREWSRRFGHWMIFIVIWAGVLGIMGPTWGSLVSWAAGMNAEGARSALGAMMTGKAAILGLVAALGTLGIQLSASTYSIRVVRAHSGSLLLAAFSLVFVLSLLFDVWLLGQIREPLSSSLGSLMVSDLTVGFFALTFVVPYALESIVQTLPDRVVRRLEVWAVKRGPRLLDRARSQIPPSNTQAGDREAWASRILAMWRYRPHRVPEADDPVLLLADLTLNSVRNRDLTTSYMGAHAINSSLGRILAETAKREGTPEPLNIGGLGEHYRRYLIQVYEAAKTAAMEDVMVEALEGLDVVWKSLRSDTQVVVMTGLTVARFGPEAVAGRLPEAASRIAEILGDMGELHAARGNLWATLDILQELTGLHDSCCKARVTQPLAYAITGISKIARTARTVDRTTFDIAIHDFDRCGLELIRGHLAMIEFSFVTRELGNLFRESLSGLDREALRTLVSSAQKFGVALKENPGGYGTSFDDVLELLMWTGLQIQTLGRAKEWREETELLGNAFVRIAEHPLPPEPAVLRTSMDSLVPFMIEKLVETHESSVPCPSCGEQVLSVQVACKCGRRFSENELANMLAGARATLHSFLTESNLDTALQRWHGQKRKRN